MCPTLFWQDTLWGVCLWPTLLSLDLQGSLSSCLVKDVSLWAHFNTILQRSFIDRFMLRFNIYCCCRAGGGISASLVTRGRLPLCPWVNQLIPKYQVCVWASLLVGVNNQRRREPGWRTEESELSWSDVCCQNTSGDVKVFLYISFILIW